MKDFKVLKNSYYDSVTLMSTTVAIKKALNLKDLVMFMGTDMNKDMMDSVGLYDQVFDEATPNDLLLGAEMEEKNEDWAEQVIEQLSNKNKKQDNTDTVYKTISQAKEAKDSNIAIISVPGIYAANEAYKALENNMHVMLFSDNVSVEDEIALKDLAIKKDLLVMGPDCGTAIINGKGLCFANIVSKGNIGLVAASGTGLQEVTVIIDRFGGGITQAIGVGGRDLSEAVGGKMMLKSIDALNSDDQTEVIVLISKPPHKTVLDKIIKKLETVNKKVVVCLLDAIVDQNIDNVYFVSTLTEAGQKALELIGKKTPNLTELDHELKANIENEKDLKAKSQTKVKGLFCGGTLTAEALSVLRDDLKDITSNVAKKVDEKMKDPMKSNGHNLVDLGDDIFTQGKPHPMIEPTIRLDRILLEAKNPETSVILLDFELGLGSHDDPVGVTIDTMIEARQLAKNEGRHISFVAYVCGTDKDSQGLEKSEKQLRDQGVFVAKTNAHAALIAAAIVGGAV
ncbi:MAG: acyl-CoA synthetase FdrA [Acholeplasmataceae bacterium]|nr:acyl-CoA synthetase FdrA [Acholeplasmataceae bacterium]